MRRPDPSHPGGDDGAAATTTPLLSTNGQDVVAVGAESEIVIPWRTTTAHNGAGARGTTAS